MCPCYHVAAPRRAWQPERKRQQQFTGHDDAIHARLPEAVQRSSATAYDLMQTSVQRGTFIRTSYDAAAAAV